MKKLLSTLLLAVTGCSTSGGGNYTSMYQDPKLFRCPSNYFAVCDGNSPTQMECECVDRQYQRDVLRSIRGVL